MSSCEVIVRRELLASVEPKGVSPRTGYGQSPDRRLVRIKGPDDGSMGKRLSSSATAKTRQRQRRATRSSAGSGDQRTTASPPLTAVVVIPHDVSAFEAALGDVMQTVGDVIAVGARPSLRPDRLVLRSRLSSGVGRSHFKIGRPIGVPSTGCPTGHF